MDILVAVAGKVVELTVEPITRQFGYLFFYRSNVDRLKEQVEKLKAARESVQRSVDAAQRNCEEIDENVQKWMRRVDEKTEQAERFYEKENHANTECSQRSCPNPWLRHQLGRKAKKMAAEVDQLKEEGNFDKVSFQTLPQCIGPSLEVKETLESRISTMNQVMEALADPAIHVIGLYGPGGVGKTTLAKEVAKKVQGEKLFEMVVLVEVKHNPLKEIQNQMADMLGLKFDMQSENELVRASRLHQRLEHEKSLLVVLDDLWERLDLNQVGISFADEGNKHCKIILTSRKKDLLTGQMNCERNIEVELLSKEEALGLFKETSELHDDVDDHYLLSIAAEIVQECAQLPLAIVAVARALRNNKSSSKWKDALLQLKRRALQNIPGVETEVYSSIKLSYDYLENQELKSTFLLSVKLSQHPTIQDTLMYSVGLDLLSVQNMKEARVRLDALVEHLKDSSLLLDSSFKNCFTVHDVVCDVALSIASKEQHALVKRQEKVEWPDEELLESCTAICLVESDIYELPEELYGPEVEFFLLKSMKPDLRIPSRFFNRMQKLKVLSLTNIVSSSLAPSVSLLEKLRTLSLHSCTLEDITVVKHLKKLKILDLSNSTIKQLPSEVGQLRFLQMLNLNGCRKLKVIPPNILSSLKNLEELYIKSSFDQWDVEGLNEGKKRASLAELKHLQKLSTLEIDIPDASVMPKDLFSANSLERYRISIGRSRWFEYLSCDSSKVLALGLDNNIDMEYGFSRLLESVEDLLLENLNGITSLCQGHITAQAFCKLRAIKVKCCDQIKYLFSISMVGTLSRLERITVTECKSIEGIVAFVSKENFEKRSGKSEFPQLRFLELENLPALSVSCFSNMVLPKLETLELRGRQAKMMWNGKFQAYQFSNVKVLRLRDLYDRAATFPYGLFYGFPNLEELDVSGGSIEVIFSCLRGPLHQNAQKAEAAPFMKLNVDDLDQLKHIWNEGCQLDRVLLNLETLKVSCCDALINLGPSFVSLENLRDLDVLGCNGLINLLTSSTARTLVQLTRLRIRSCDKIEEIITNGEDAETEIVFMKLKILELSELSNCKGFCCHKCTFIFPSLDEAIIGGCLRFRMFCTGFLSTPLLRSVNVENNEIHLQNDLNKTVQQLFDQKVSLFHGTHLKTNEHPELVDILNGKLIIPEASFSNLTSLVVDKCVSLSNHVIPSCVLTSLINLNRLTVSDCDSVEVVFDLEGINVYKEAHTLPAIPLRFLELIHLPKLKYVWNKDPLRIDCFQSLADVTVKECESLRNIFPASIAKGLTKLLWLEIESSGVEVIVAEDQTPMPTIDFVFPQLCWLYLIKLANLKNFYPQRHTIECPQLGTIDVRQCKKVMVFNWKVPKITEKDADDGDENQYPLFLFEKVSSRLNELTLNQNDVTMMRNDQFQDELFENVYTLYLDSFHDDEPLVFPYTLLESFPRLDELTIGHSSFKDIFPCQESPSDPSRKIPLFTQLTLTHLDQLQSIWNEDSHIYPVLQNLVNLDVNHCSTLINIAPSSASFDNLKWLKVSNCHGLSYLLTAATTRSLVMLKNLEIQDCKIMEEIVTNKDEDVEDTIALENLIHVELVDLPVLKSFCTKTCTFKFPSLDEVIVTRCPKMKIFCEGVLDTPWLKFVEVEENKWH